MIILVISFLEEKCVMLHQTKHVEKYILKRYLFQYACLNELFKFKYAKDVICETKESQSDCKQIIQRS